MSHDAGKVRTSFQHESATVRTMTNAKHLVLAIAMTLVAAAAVAAIEYGRVELVQPTPAGDRAVTAIPRVVENPTAATDPPIVRIVVVGHRIDEDSER